MWRRWHWHCQRPQLPPLHLQQPPLQPMSQMLAGAGAVAALYAWAWLPMVLLRPHDEKQPLCMCMRLARGPAVMVQTDSPALAAPPSGRSERFLGPASSARRLTLVVCKTTSAFAVTRVPNGCFGFLRNLQHLNLQQLIAVQMSARCRDSTRLS